MNMIRVSKSIVVLFLTLLVCSYGVAQENIQVSTIFDKKTLEVDDQLSLNIRISGAKVNIQRPRIPISESFESYYSGRSTRFSFVNGKQDSITEFRYVLIPKRAGIFNVGPIEVNVNSDIYRTEVVQIEVLGTPGMQQTNSPALGQSTSLPVNSPDPNYSSPTRTSLPQTTTPYPYSGGSSPSVNEQASGNEPIFLKAWVDKTAVYPGQQISLTYSLYTRADTRYEGFEEEPQATGFWVEEIPIGRDIEKTTVTVGGRRYIKADIKKLALFPTSPGQFQIEPGTVKASIEQRSGRNGGMFDDFFNDSFFGGGMFSRRVNKLLTTPILNIQVRELPERGKPSQFSGIVGRFQFEAVVDRVQVKQNEPITLSLKIEGEGNIETLQHPPIPKIDNFKIYDGESSSQLLKRRDVIVGSKIFEIIFIPENTGDYVIPSLVFNYFDPYSHSYKAIRSKEFKVKVLPGEAQDELRYVPSDQQESLKKDLKKEAKDIYTIKTDFRVFKFYQFEQKMKNVFVGVSSALGLLFLMLFFFQMKSPTNQQDHVVRKRRSASRLATKSVKRMEKIMKSSGKTSVEVCAEIGKILDRYFADKMNVSIHSMSMSVVKERMAEIEMGDDVLRDVEVIYDLRDRAQFTGYEPTEQENRQMIDLIEKVVMDLDKSL